MSSATRTRAAILAALFLAAGNTLLCAQDAAVATSGAPITNRSGLFETRFAIAPFDSVKAIYERPTVISTRTFDSSRTGAVESITDVHAIFPVDPKELFLVLSDYDHYVGVSARTVYSKDFSTNDRPLGYHRQLQYLSARFMGMGETYHYITNNYEVELPGGAYGIKWNLEQSLDGKFFELYGSWYLAPITVDSVECTYIRYYLHNGMTSRPPIPYSLLSYLTGNDVESLIRAFVRETERRYPSGN